MTMKIANADVPICDYWFARPKPRMKISQVVYGAKNIKGVCSRCYSQSDFTLFSFIQVDICMRCLVENFPRCSYKKQLISDGKTEMLRIRVRK